MTSLEHDGEPRNCLLKAVSQEKIMGIRLLVAALLLVSRLGYAADADNTLQTTYSRCDGSESGAPASFLSIFGGPSVDMLDRTSIRSLIETSDGGYAIAAATGSFGAEKETSNYLVIKLSSQGIPAWAKTFGGSETDFPTALLQDRDDHYHVTGYSWSFRHGLLGLGSTTSDIFSILLDADGKPLGASASGPGNGRIFSAIPTSDQGIAETGFARIHVNKTEAMLIKSDAGYRHQWAKIYRGGGEHTLWSLIQSSDGGYALAGQFTKSGDIYKDASALFLKTDSEGNPQWAYTYSAGGIEMASSIVQTRGNGFAIAACTRYAKKCKMLVLKTDAQGKIVWAKTFGAEHGSIAPNGMAETPDGGCWLQAIPQISRSLVTMLYS